MSRIANALAAPAVTAFRALPGRWRERIKIACGVAGHAPAWAQRLRARRLAADVKRLDHASMALAHILARAGVERLRDTRCLEFGSGHLLSEALAYHLAGARQIVAVDYFPILQADSLHLVCRDADPEKVVEALARFDSPVDVRTRLDALLARRDWSLQGLSELGISYVAPHDVARSPLGYEGFDVITSNSVLEHVPARDAPAILRNLFEMLAPHGVMSHGIHLEDHRDFAREPFAFLAADTDWTEEDCDRRGNRLRPSDWQRLVRDLQPASIEVLVQPGNPSKLPSILDTGFRCSDPADLSAAGLALTVRKIA
jgi:SAM-dependent methyltransferase